MSVQNPVLRTLRICAIPSTCQLFIGEISTKTRRAALDHAPLARLKAPPAFVGYFVPLIARGNMQPRGGKAWEWLKMLDNGRLDRVA
jgi:hypothetical protein